MKKKTMATHVEVAVFPHVPNNPMYASNTSPRTPAGAVVLAAPLSYGDDATDDVDVVATNTKQQPPQYDYDADIDATLRTMEKEDHRAAVARLPQRSTGRGDADDGPRRPCREDASLLHKLRPRTGSAAPRSLLRRPVLVGKKINRDERQIRLLGAAAVFAVAKYEDRNTCRRSMSTVSPCTLGAREARLSTRNASCLPRSASA
ncbi:hypothetical protein ZEAMMB73_Zm00001d000397 [Zea mays]|nr:hypothetical protein ZEAMMB73_Zm00001d000397 [Zea mays]